LEWSTLIPRSARGWKLHLTSCVFMRGTDLSCRRSSTLRALIVHEAGPFQPPPPPTVPLPWTLTPIPASPNEPFLRSSAARRFPFAQALLFSSGRETSGRAPRRAECRAGTPGTRARSARRLLEATVQCACVCGVRGRHTKRCASRARGRRLQGRNKKCRQRHHAFKNGLSHTHPTYWEKSVRGVRRRRRGSGERE
jgi:hypothetical protein